MTSPQRGRVGGPKKVTRGDKGRDPIFSRGDVSPKLLFYYKSYNHHSNFGAFSKIGTKTSLLKANFRNFLSNCLININNMKNSSKKV